MTAGCISEEARLARKAEQEEQSLRRARTMIRRTVLAARLDHLLTLTIRGNLTDRKAAWGLLTRYVRKLRYELGKRRGLPRGT
ncbi:hypothetical protein, partial [Paralimibaculum aggregatum]|uniref:hypothetical protein n=1 Tax=Paralimibaculum aggregatum TaxID=3036245 RepID=UPI0025532C4D